MASVMSNAGLLDFEVLHHCLYQNSALVTAGPKIMQEVCPVYSVQCEYR